MDNWWQKTTPDKPRDTPWISPAATEFLDGILQPDFEVLEHGSGGSTVWMAERVQSVIAVENNAHWRREGKNISMIVSLDQIYKSYDLLFIDGEPVAERAGWIKAVPKLVKPGGWVVLDNANRPEYAEEREWLKSVSENVTTFDGNIESTSYLVTEFYQLKAQE